MARRRTIRDNPLDSVTVPSDDDASSKARTVNARRVEPGDTEGRPSSPADDVKETMRRLRPYWVYRMFHRHPLRILTGAAGVRDTHLTTKRDGADRGFHLAYPDFVSIREDVATLSVLSTGEARHLEKLILWGTAGAFIAGPVGALIGSFYGARTRHLSLVEMQIKDGRKLLLVAYPETVWEMQAELA